MGGRTVWKAGGAEAPCFISLGADEAYWMRTVSGGGCWDLKIGGGDGWDGLKGMNKFLEDSSDFSGVAVSTPLFSTGLTCCSCQRVSRRSRVLLGWLT